MYDALAEGGVIGYARRFLTILGTKPPLITVLPTPFFLLLGRNAHVAYGINLVFMAVLFAAVFCIGRRYWDTRVGLLAAYITGTMPLLYGLSRWFMTDFALAALVSMAIYFLIGSHDFDDLRKTFLLGVTCGMGLLMKVTFPLYVVFPFVFVLCRRLVRTKRGSASQSSYCSTLLNSMLVLALPVIWLAFPWYYLNCRRAFERIIISGFSDEADYFGTGLVFTLHAMETYLIKLINMGPSVYYVGLLVLLLSLLIFTGRGRSLRALFPREAVWVFSLWALPFLVFLFGRNKDIRFVAPLLPLFSLVSAPILGFSLGQQNRWGKALPCLVLAFPMVSLLHVSFRILGNWHLAVGDFLVASPQLAYARPYDRLAWPHTEILKSVCTTTQFSAGKKKWLMVGTDRAWFNANNLELAAVQARMPLQITTSAYERDRSQLLSTLRSMSFFIYKEGGEPESGFYNQHVSALLQEVREGGSFAELPIHPTVPDGGQIHVYKNRFR